MPEDLLVDSRHTRSDLRRMEHALSTGWKIPDAVMEIIPARLLKIMSEGGHREQIAAARVLVAMHGQNKGPAPGATIQVGVAVNGNSSQPDDRRTRTLAIAERIRAGRVS